MAAVSKMKGVNVHVYEQCGSSFKRISAFDHEDSPETKPIIRVLYGGGVHYGKHTGSELLSHSLLNVYSLITRCFGGINSIIF